MSKTITLTRPEFDPTRVCKDGILNEYLLFTEPTEAPPDFHKWMCISMVAAALSQTCYVDLGFFRAYPNLYTILVGEAGLSKKSASIEIAKGIFIQAAERIKLEPNFISNTATPQAIVQDLLDVARQNKDERCEGIITSSELSTFIKDVSRDESLVQMLTNFWDFHKDYKERTIARGAEKLTNVLLHLWSGSTEIWLKQAIPVSTLEGGFFSRLCLIRRPETGKRIAFPKDHITPELEEAKERVVQDLSKVFKLEGEFSLTPKAKRYYEEWYEEDVPKEVAKASPHMRGYFARKGTMVLKLAMVFSADRGNSMTIDIQDIEEALRLLDENETHLSGLVEYLGSTQEGREIDMVRDVAAKLFDRAAYAKQYCEDEIDGEKVEKVYILHCDLQRRLSSKFKATSLNSLVETLIEEGYFESKYVKTGLSRKPSKIYTLNSANQA